MAKQGVRLSASGSTLRLPLLLRCGTGAGPQDGLAITVACVLRQPVRDAVDVVEHQGPLAAHIHQHAVVHDADALRVGVVAVQHLVLHRVAQHLPPVAHLCDHAVGCQYAVCDCFVVCGDGLYVVDTCPCAG
jgi:hypothetical protein